MATTTHVRSKVTAIIAMVFLLPALIFFIMWLSTDGLDAGEKESTYLAKFPSMLQSLTTIHMISIICCVLSMALAARSFRKHLLSIRILMLVTVLAAAIILLFDFFQMV